ncbi:MAG: hypothetical protein ACP5O3_03445 [Candidatus Micrarchaeia archaeon]
MRKNERGQQALEYLVTYGWAILVIVIIAAVLWYFGVFNPSKWAAEKQCGGFSSFSCNEFKLSASASNASGTGFSVIVLGNKQGRAVSNVTLVAVTSEAGVVVGGGINPANDAIRNTTPMPCTNNLSASSQVNVTGSNNADATQQVVCQFYVSDAYRGVVGAQSDQVNLVIGFVDSSTNVAHNDSGFVKGKWE